MSDPIIIRTDTLTVAVDPLGAELSSIRGRDGVELLWQGGTAWTRRAPVLFPIVGRLTGDTLRHKGQAYTMTQHGFARDREFRVVEASPVRVVMRLSDDAASRAIYPFPFSLELVHAVEGSTLTVIARVENPGPGTLPFGLGAHPGFRWPLVDDVPKADHVVVFDADEAPEALSVVGGLLGPPRPIPLMGRTLPLSEALFADDALVLPDVRSRSVRYAALKPDGSEARALAFSWEGYPDLGLWSKPTGAPFLCIEPWLSMASPVGWDGEFTEKPGVVSLAPGESRTMTWRVTV